MRHADERQIVKRRKRRWIAVAASLLVVAVGGVVWRSRAPGPEATGTPRLAVDRTEIDLGHLPFQRPARATFTLTNVGDGLLTIAGAPSVRVVQGC